MLNIGLIGNGSIAGAHKSAYKRLQEQGIAQIAAFCDVRPERLEGDPLTVFTDARTYTDYKEMLKAEAGKLDFVDICVPTFLHAEIAIAAMEAGFDVLSEKPMARTVEQAERMVEASKKTGKRLMIAYCNRFNQAARLIKDVIDSKKYGKVISAEFHRRGGSDAEMGWMNWFRDFKLSGSATLDYQIHDVDMIRWMFGMPKAVSMVGGNYTTKGGGYDIMNGTFVYDDMFVSAFCDWYTANEKFTQRVIRVNFENGYIYAERTAGRQAFFEVPRNGDPIDHAEDNVFDAYYEEIKYFAELVRDGKKLDYNFPDESVDSVRLVMAELESADNGGKQVKL